MRTHTWSNNDEPSLIELARENGKTHWLDLTTGRQFTSTDSTPLRAQVDPDAARREAELLAPVLDVFDQHGYAVGRSTNTRYVLLARSGVTYQVCFIADADADIVCSCTFAAVPAPARRRAAVAEAMARINTRLCSGNFDVDSETGYMRFRISAFLGGGELTPTMADYLVHEGTRMWDTYAGELAQAIRGGIARPAVIRPNAG